MLNKHEFDVVRKYLRRYTPPSNDVHWVFVGSSELRLTILTFVLHQQYSKGGILDKSLTEVLQEAFPDLSSALRAIIFGELMKAELAHEFWFQGEVIAWITPTLEMRQALNMSDIIQSLDSFMQYFQNAVITGAIKQEIAIAVMQLVKQQGVAKGKKVVECFQDYFDPVYFDGI